VKIGPVDAEIFSVDLKKKLHKVKYIARSASLPSGLNYLERMQRALLARYFSAQKQQNNAGTVMF